MPWTNEVSLLVRNPENRSDFVIHQLVNHPPVTSTRAGYAPTLGSILHRRGNVQIGVMSCYIIGCEWRYQNRQNVECIVHADT